MKRPPSLSLRSAAVVVTSMLGACTPLDPATARRLGGDDDCAGDEPCRQPLAVAVAGTVGTSFVLDDRGVVYSLGFERWNDRGGMALGTCERRTSAVGAVDGLGPVVAITAGEQFAIARDAEGRLYSWGRNGAGELGAPDVDRCTPRPIEGLPEIADVAAGYHHVLALDVFGDVWAWGDNAWGQLGTGDERPVSGPVRVANLPPIRQVAAGWGFSLALAEDGRIFSWGGSGTRSHEYGELGRPRDAPSVPGLVAGVPTNVRALANGSATSFAMLDDGRVFGWGANFEGELCLGYLRETARPEPTLIPALFGAESITCGHAHCLALDARGDVLACGDNTRGQAGNASRSPGEADPKRSHLDVAPALLSAGGQMSFAVDVDGRAWLWGANVGDEDTLMPELVELPRVRE
ncbi:hypothetical protein L6R52_33525 [Myxococcota bacterium]|nr:hypothetical protein [Myxococcota bacterium]